LDLDVPRYLLGVEAMLQVVQHIEDQVEFPLDRR
jgi:hypothetical protein